MGDILKKVSKNDIGRDFCIGDLHGSYDDFQLLLDRLDFDPKVDRMFSVGDLVDRGPKSIECLRLIKEPWFYSVRGNHEDLMITAVLNNQNAHHWYMNGGDWGHADGIDTDEVIELTKLASCLPLAIELETDFGRLGICHAESPKDWASVGNDMERDAKYELIWSREKIQSGETWIVENIDFTIHGHTPIMTPATFGNSLYIDTGICFKGRKLIDGRVLEGELTCVEISRVPDMAINTSWGNVEKRLAEKGKDLFD